MELVKTVDQRNNSAGKVRILSARFSVDKSKMRRGDAWNMCRLQGERNGIPQHAWTKAHGNGKWQWYTCSFVEFKRRNHQYEKRRRNER